MAYVVIPILLMVFHWFDIAGKGAIIFLLGITGLMALLLNGSVVRAVERQSPWRPLGLTPQSFARTLMADKPVTDLSADF